MLFRSGNPPYIPNYYWIGSGYDVAYDSMTSISKAIRQPIIVLGPPTQTPDGRWSIPNNTATTPPTEMCSCSSNATTIQTAYAYQSQVGESIGGKVGFFLFSGGLSTDMKNTYGIISKSNTYIYDCWSTCGYYGISFLKYTPLNVTSQFRTAVGTLPESFDPNSPLSTINKFYQFYTTFGSNIVFGAELGGWIYQRMETSSNAQANFEQQSIDVQQEARVTFGLSLGESIGVYYSSSELNAFSSATQFSTLSFYGGRLSSGQNTCASWTSTVPENPAPTGLKLVPIENFISEAYFPNDPNILKRAKAYTDYLNYYYTTKLEFYSLYPGYSQSMNVGGQYMQKSTSYCPEGTYILSGGCSTDYSPSMQYPWKLSSSYPQFESGGGYPIGWNCLMGEDDGSGVNYQTVRSYSVCSPKTIGNLQTINRTIVTPTESYTSNGYISAQVSCPSETLLIGGGCSISNTANSNYLYRTIYNAPGQNGTWYCYFSGDFGLPTWPTETATAYAICGNWSSNLQYNSDVYKNYRIVQNTVSDQPYENESTVTCPAHYISLGGGCSTDRPAGAGYHWRITNSYPVSNGWTCTANQDNGANSTYNTVTAYAICVQFANMD